MRARAFGVHMLAYDPYVEELVVSQYGVEPVDLTELLQRSDIVSMHALRLRMPNICCPNTTSAR